MVEQPALANLFTNMGAGRRAPRRDFHYLVNSRMPSNLKVVQFIYFFSRKNRLPKGGLIVTLLVVPSLFTVPE